VANLLPQHRHSNHPDEQPESSGGEAGESRVRNGVREMWPTKHLTYALWNISPS
jgi:hypothetical protein